MLKHTAPHKIIFNLLNVCCEEVSKQIVKPLAKHAYAKHRQTYIPLARDSPVVMRK